MSPPVNDHLNLHTRTRVRQGWEGKPSSRALCGAMEPRQDRRGRSVCQWASTADQQGNVFMEIKQEETTAQAEPYLPPPVACL